MTATGAWTQSPFSRYKFVLTPDWVYFQCAQMTDPFFHARVEEFLTLRYQWTDEDKLKLFQILLKRYNEFKSLPDEDFARLQELGVTCYNYATKFVDGLDNFNAKDLVLGYLEVIRRFLVEWIK